MQHEPRQAIFTENPVEVVWAGLQVEKGRVSRNHLSRTTSISYFDEDLATAAA